MGEVTLPFVAGGCLSFEPYQVTTESVAMSRAQIDAGFRSVLLNRRRLNVRQASFLRTWADAKSMAATMSTIMKMIRPAF